MTSRERDTDVIVVGAGLTGLAAALELSRRGIGVTVLERGDAVGGRVRTDVVDGFLIDRGFQLINPIYPALREYADLRALDLHAFGSGAQVLTGGSLETLAHPARHPLQLANTLGSGLLTPRDLRALIGSVAGGPGSVPRGEVPRGTVTLGEELDERGAGGALRQQILEPFLTGVVASDPNDVDAEVGRFLLTTFAFGRPSVPARGAQALPEQLAASARLAGAEICLDTACEAITSTGSGATVRTTGGGTLRAGAVIVATSPSDQGEPMYGLATYWFRADEAPSTTPFIRIDGTHSGPVLHTAVMTNSAPSYSPDGSALIEASTLLDASGNHPSPDLAAVTGHLSALWRTDAARWDVVAVSEVANSLPVQSPASRRTMRRDGAVLRTGDHVGGGSQHGAMAAGRAAATAALEVIGAAEHRES